MTPEQALAQALDIDLSSFWDYGEFTDENGGVGYTATLNRERLTTAILAALRDLGWTVARTEHAEDGEALARLREALPDGTAITAEWYHGEWRVTGYTGTAPRKHGPTLADAADACRAAIEAQP